MQTTHWPFPFAECLSSHIRTSLRLCRSLFPGNGNLKGRDNGVEKARQKQPIVSRDKARARNPARPALFARHREISVCMGLRGGVGRTRTSNQAIMRATLLDSARRRCRSVRRPRDQLRLGVKVRRVRPNCYPPGHASESRSKFLDQVVDLFGGRTRTRTLDSLIKSQVKP